MAFHPDKCTVLSVTTKRKPIKHNYTLHNHTLEPVSSSKYLGITLQSNLKWDNHIHDITAKANKTLGFLKRNLKTANQNIKDQAYRALVRPKLEYASSVWDPHTKESASKLEMIQRRGARVFCGTWNVNGQHPPISVAKWLQRDDVPPDVRLIRLVGIMLIVYVKDPIVGSVHFVDADYVPTGIMGIMGNKGGVGVRLSINNTSILFINSHLAAHQDEFERRNQDYRDIAAKMKFRQFVPPLTIDEHDMVFWIGDLNYRISGLEIDVVKSMIEHEKFTDLQSYDQLHQQLGRSPDVFPGYMEGKVLFRPTYKYNPGTDEWDSSEKNRIPAWCDRILFKGPGINLLQYREHSELLISDHKPVSASFEVQVKVVDEEKSKRVYEDIMKKLDRLENDYLPQVKLDKTEFTFTDVRFIEPMEHTLTVSNTGQVPVEFEFIEKLDEKSYCKPWMTLSPFKSVIAPGDKCEVQLEVYVDKSSVAHLNSGMDQIDDILVLHLAGGKDFFISFLNILVNGNFIASSFGCSVEALVQMHGPIREIPVAQLVEIEQPGSLLKRDMTQGGRLYAVPKEVWRLVDHIWQYGQKESSLFQQPGLHKEILAIRDCLDTGVPDRIPGSVHSVAEALLLFLESLPDPVIPCSVYHRCLDCSNNFMLCKQVLSQIPECHKNVFVYVCAFLRELLTHAEENNLEVKFLASIFGEVLLRPSKQPSPPSAMGSEHSSARAMAKEEEMKRAAFIYHFLTNDFYE
ncbi:hypothetical protein FSP39_019707 [Pinctada imbricata]|uniref:Rho-GAP domain-containing protein n=1 Tax=Pinctada imbricata TaxID=66713 RepID=A0AA89C420_PINIB|nr:hypothetical protein FSP39_019707 [Pinctada imbricata]